MAKCLLRRGGLVLLKTSACCGLPIFLKANHQLESRVPEIGLLGSEGGATSSVVPTPIVLAKAGHAGACPLPCSPRPVTRERAPYRARQGRSRGSVPPTVLARFRPGVDHRRDVCFTFSGKRISLRCNFRRLRGPSRGPIRTVYIRQKGARRQRRYSS